MKRLFMVLFAMLGLLNAAIGQQHGYLRFTRNSVVSGKNFYKGEIFPLVRPYVPVGQNFFMLGEDSMKVEKDAEQFAGQPLDLTGAKASLVKPGEPGFISIDISLYAKAKDTCIITTEGGDSIPLISVKTVTQEKKKLGRYFRIHLPGAVSLIYKTDEIGQTPAPTDPPAVVTPATTGDGMPWLTILAYVLAAVGIGFGILMFMKNKAMKQEKADSASLSEQIKTAEKNILARIGDTGGGSPLPGDPGKSKKAEKEMEELKSTITTLKDDKTKLEKENLALRDEKGSTSSDLNQLKDKVLEVDYLKPQCDGVLAYLRLCEDIRSKAYQLYNAVSTRNAPDAVILGQLLIHFEQGIKNLPIGKWAQVVQDIRDTGVTGNKDVKTSFRQLNTPDERKEQFTRLLLSEFLIAYTSHTAILAEAFRSLSGFGVSADTGSEASSLFGKSIAELTGAAKTTGIKTVKYAPLFRSVDDYPVFIALVDRKSDAPYSGIAGLKKGSILQILSYGIETDFNDQTPTQVIQA